MEREHNWDKILLKKIIFTLWIVDNKLYQNVDVSDTFNKVFLKAFNFYIDNNHKMDDTN